MIPNLEKIIGDLLVFWTTNMHTDTQVHVCISKAIPKVNWEHCACHHCDMLLLQIYMFSHVLVLFSVVNMTFTCSCRIFTF